MKKSDQIYYDSLLTALYFIYLKTPYNELTNTQKEIVKNILKEPYINKLISEQESNHD